jgi:hypothetical protein
MPGAMIPQPYAAPPMFLLPDSEAYYKNLAHYLQHQSSSFSDARVVKEVIHWSGFTAASVRMALHYGTEPRVRVTGLGPFTGNASVHFGQTPNNGAHIQVSRAMIWLLEGIPHALLFGTDRRSANPLAKAGQELIRTIKTTLLHELVHWGNIQSRTLWTDTKTRRRVPDDEELRLEDGIEAGDEFEKSAGLSTRVPAHFLEPQPLELSSVFMPRTPPPP